MSSKITLLPEYISVVQNTSINFYNGSTNILTAIGSYLAELNQNIEFEKGLVTTNMLSAFGLLFNTLNASDFNVDDYDINGNKTGTKTLDETFKLFFIEKYQSFSADYKAKIDTLISNNAYFIDFSDDIGYVSDTNTVFDCNVNPYYDTFDSAYFLPLNLPVTLVNKVSKNELRVLKQFSYYGDGLLKQNLKGLQNNVNKGTAMLPHGTNLVTDILYYDRAHLNQLSILSTLKAILGEISDFILFFKQINPKDQDTDREAIFFKYTITNLEGLQQSVDILKNQLDKVKLSTISVLT